MPVFLLITVSSRTNHSHWSEPRVLVALYKSAAMPKKQMPKPPAEVEPPVRSPEWNPEDAPETEPLPPEEEPDVIPDDDPYTTPPEEMPEPGEGP